MEQAVALDPLAPGVRVAVSNFGLATRRYDVAAQEAGRALALEPTLMFAHAQQVLGDLLTGHVERCDTRRRLDPYVGVRAMCLYSLGRVREAVQLADSLGAAFRSGTAGDSSFSPVFAARGLAEYYAWTGDAEQSRTWLERAYALSPEGEDFRALASGIYDKVRADPRFQAGLQKIRAQSYERVQQAMRSFAEQLSGVTPRKHP